MNYDIGVFFKKMCRENSSFVKTNRITGNGENYIMKSLVICTPYRILCGW